MIVVLKLLGLKTYLYIKQLLRIPEKLLRTFMYVGVITQYLC